MEFSEWSIISSLNIHTLIKIFESSVNIVVALKVIIDDYLQSPSSNEPELLPLRARFVVKIGNASFLAAEIERR